MRRFENWTDDTLDKLIDLIKKTNTVSCDEITSGDYWNDKWDECLVCGCKPDEYGLWVHVTVQ